jgi:hypothetical protein
MTNQEMQKWVDENTELTNYEWVRSRLFMRLLPKTFNPMKMAVRTSADKFGFDDLVIAPYIRLAFNPDDGILTTGVTPVLLKTWGVTKEQVFTDAYANSFIESTIEPMAEVMTELLGVELVEGVPLYVVSNKNRMFGAFSVIPKAPMLERMFPEGYVVFPSSIHECIVMPKSRYMPEMADMVSGMNTMLNDEDILSDNVYEFRGYNDDNNA